MADKLKYKIFDGRKAVEIWGDENLDGWTVLSGDDGKNKEAGYYKFIPTLFRAVQLRAYGVSTMPFELYKGKTVYDRSAEWKNKVGFLPNPVQLLQLIESALVMAGRAYVFKERSVAGTKALHYHIPTKITPKIDEMTGKIEYFERPVKFVTKKFKPEDYIYFWQPDPYVEVGPPLHFPAQAAANACGVLSGIDLFSASFFERGAIKAMLLTVKGISAKGERDMLSDWWRRVVGGVKNAFGAQVINAEAITPVVIGEGIKELEGVTIGTEKREDIAVALGIPMSILFANAANYATSQQDELNFLTKTIIPECVFIASVLNEQLFEPIGLHLEFLPETLDAMQEDEASRAVALGQLVTAGFDLLTATEILGYELTKDQLARLQAEEEAKEERAAEMADRLAGNEQTDEPEEEDAETQEELRRWERKALNAVKRAKPADVPFESVSLPAAMMSAIHTSLAGCATAEDVRIVFAGVSKDGETTTPVLPFGDAILTLAAELKRANDLLEADGQAASAG
jgi:HK97 family phage portal protein